MDKVRRDLAEKLDAFADTMEGVNRYYMTAQSTYERLTLIREAAAALRSTPQGHCS